jgi:hypothetical protein
VVIVYLVAAAGAALAAFGATRDPNIPYWRRDRVALTFALGWIYSLYAVMGAFVALLAEHAGWHLISDHHGGQWVNGLAYGIAAYLILRWDVIPFVVIATAPAKMLVNVFLGRFAQRLDVAAATAIERKVGDLTPDQLIKLSWRLYRKYVAKRVGKKEMKPRVAKADKERLLGLCAEVRQAEPVPDSDLAAREVAAIEFLRDYVSEVLIGEHDGRTYIG